MFELILKLLLCLACVPAYLRVCLVPYVAASTMTMVR